MKKHTLRVDVDGNKNEITETLRSIIRNIEEGYTSGYEWNLIEGEQ